MSKLKISSALCLFALSGFFLWKYLSSASLPASVLTSENLIDDEIRLWGKAEGPLQVRIEFKEQNGNRVTLEGQIRSKLENFEVSWKLPEGVTLVDGQLSETIHQTPVKTLHKRLLVVDVQWPLAKPHLVLRAAENESPDSFGASTVFNLDPSLLEMEKEEIIRAQMKSRRLQKLMK